MSFWKSTTIRDRVSDKIRNNVRISAIAKVKVARKNDIG